MKKTWSLIASLQVLGVFAVACDTGVPKRTGLSTGTVATPPPGSLDSNANLCANGAVRPAGGNCPAATCLAPKIVDTVDGSCRERRIGEPCADLSKPNTFIVARANGGCEDPAKVDANFVCDELNPTFRVNLTARTCAAPGATALVCTAPQVLNTAGTACEAPATTAAVAPGATAPVCTAPKVLNAAGTACEAPATTAVVAPGVTTPVCTAPQVLNSVKTACEAPAPTTPATTQAVAAAVCNEPLYIKAMFNTFIISSAPAKKNCYLAKGSYIVLTEGQTTVRENSAQVHVKIKGICNAAKAVVSGCDLAEGNLVFGAFDVP